MLGGAQLTVQPRDGGDGGRHFVDRRSRLRPSRQDRRRNFPTAREVVLADS